MQSSRAAPAPRPPTFLRRFFEFFFFFPHFPCVRASFKKVCSKSHHSPGLLASPSRMWSSVQSARECSRQSWRKRAWVRLTRLSRESRATVCSHSFQPLNQPANTPTWSRNIMVSRRPEEKTPLRGEKINNRESLPALTPLPPLRFGSGLKNNNNKNERRIFF